MRNRLAQDDKLAWEDIIKSIVHRMDEDIAQRQGRLVGNTPVQLLRKVVDALDQINASQKLQELASRVPEHLLEEAGLAQHKMH